MLNFFGCLLLLLSFPGFANAQNLAKMHLISKPQKSTSEIVTKRDVNGEFCAGIQVVSDMDGFSYDSYNGVVQVDDLPGKDLVYLSPDERVLEIFHTGYKPLKLILSEIGIHLRPKEVWIIEISGEKVLDKLPIAIITKPEGAQVFIDGDDRGRSKQQTVSVGSHQLRLVKAGYEPVIRTIAVDARNILFEFTLKAIEDVAVEITSRPTGATVYIDNVKIGQTPVSDFFPSGRYPVRLEKEWYVKYEDFLEIKPPATRQILTLREDFGTLLVSSQPASGLEIFIDDRPQNKQTPFTFARLRPGKYRVKARSKLHETPEQTVEITRQGRQRVKLLTEATFATLNITTMEGAAIYLNNKRITRLQNILLEPQVVRVRAEKPPKAKPVEKRLVLKKQQTYTLELFPQIPLGAIQVAVVPFAASIELTGDAGESYTATQSHSFHDIPAGRYQLKVSHHGYKTFRRDLLLTESDVLKERVKLEEDSDVPENFVFVEGGTFRMGSNAGESDEKPLHTVTVSSFYISKYEVTQAEWRQVMGKNPSHFKGDNKPVESVSWYDAVEFCNKKSLQAGLRPCYKISKNRKDRNNKSAYDKMKWTVTCDFSANGYRLPTEAEWEFAARGGKKSRVYKYSGSDNLKQVGWYSSNSGSKTHPVNQKQQNELGLYDMSGNVWEWCWDWHDSGYYKNSPRNNPQGPSSGKQRVLRGGSWVSFPDDLRCVNRNYYYPNFRNSNMGFRCVQGGG